MAGRKLKMIYGILAFLLFAVLAGVTLWCESTGERLEELESPSQYDVVLPADYNMVVFGDSILGQIRDKTGIPYQVAEALGMKVYNAAMGGTCMGRQYERENPGDIKDALSMVSLSKSVVSGDFRMQKLVETDESGMGYFPHIIEQIRWIDFSKVELLLIGYGTNDYHAGEQIYNEDNPYDEYTYTGALRSVVRTLQNAYPDMRIVLVTSPYTWYTNEGLTCEEYVLGGNVLKEYVDALLETAEELGVEAIDLYHDAFPHDTWEDWQRYSVDGLHPNEDGRNLLSQIIIDYFEENPQEE